MEGETPRVMAGVQDLAAARVLMISSLWPPVVLGGAESYAASLAAQLRARGAEVGAVTFGVSGPDVVAEVRPRPYRLERYASASVAQKTAFHLLDIYRPETAGTIRRAIRDFAPDVVHTHSVAGLSSAALALDRGPATGHVHTLHDYWLLCRRATLVKRNGSACESRCLSCRAVSRLRNRIIARRPPDVVLAVSSAVAAEHAALAWMKGRVRIAHNPVAAMGRRPRRATGLVFGYLGRLTRDKGVATLVAAFAKASLPEDARLVIGGDGPLARELVATAPPRVEFAGWLDADARDAFYERIDALVVPSQWKDPAPLVVNEARARGIAVIGARIGGIPELIAPGSQRLLFRPGDDADLAAKLRLFAEEQASFAPGDADGAGGAPDWDAHLAIVNGAYEEARRLAGARS